MSRQRGRRWIADVRLPDGTRQRPAFDTEAEADAWEAAARLAVAQGKPLPALVRQTAHTKSLTLLGNIYDHVWATEWSSARAASTMQRYGTYVVNYFGRNKPLMDISSADVATMKVHFAGQGMAPATVNRLCSALSKLYTVANEAQVINYRPTIKWNAEVQTRFRFLDDKEERVVLAYWLGQGYEDDHDLTMFLIDTGARCWSEGLPVAWTAFGPKFSTVTFWHTKTNRPRTVPLTKRVRDAMRRRAKLYGDLKGPFAMLNKNTTVERWKSMREVTTLSDVTPYTLRHTCCTRLVLGGVDVKRVMEWMGHSAIVTTMRYMQIKPTSLDEVLHVLEGAPRRRGHLRVVSDVDEDFDDDEEAA